MQSAIVLKVVTFRVKKKCDCWLCHTVTVLLCLSLNGNSPRKGKPSDG